MFYIFFSLVKKVSMMASKYNIKRLEQQKAKVLEAQATIDCKIQEAEERKCQIEAEKAVKKAKKEEEKRVRLLLSNRQRLRRSQRQQQSGVHQINLFIPYTRW